MHPDCLCAKAQTLSPGERVFAIGAPLGLEASITDGIISGVRHDDSGPVIQASAAISPGSSGGALIDSYGYLIGITRYSLTDGQNLNFAIPAEELTRFEDGQNQLIVQASRLAERRDQEGLKQCLRAADRSADSYQSAVAKLCIGYYFFRTGELKGAEQFVREALVANANMPFAHYALAVLLEASGNKDGARLEYDVAQRMRPNDNLLAAAAKRSKSSK